MTKKSYDSDPDPWKKLNTDIDPGREGKQKSYRSGRIRNTNGEYGIIEP
jgi:hypothetical protein